MNCCSSCYFSSASKTLEDAEEEMLKLYCERSNLKDGHTVLDVGCGWGSLTLFIAKNYSSSRVTGICNSTTQKAFIEEKCRYISWYCIVCFNHCACHIVYNYLTEQTALLAWHQYLSCKSCILWWSKSLFFTALLSGSCSCKMWISLLQTLAHLKWKLLMTEYFP